jgi:fermentation-respiration switch protein FrsA (DUF1100 family)
LNSAPFCLQSPPKKFYLHRLLLSTLLGLLLALLVLAILPPWLFVYALTHPKCGEPIPISGVSVPEEHWLVTGDGHLLRAWYYPSQNGAAILALGGMGGSLGVNLPPVEFLARRGYGILQIDSRACAKPPGPVTLGYREARDAAAGLTFLLERPEIDPNRIGTFGFSMGAAAAIRCAANQPQIAALVADGGYSNLGENFAGYKQGGFYAQVTGFLSSLAYRTLTGLDPNRSSPVDDIAALHPRPLLLIYGEAEDGPPVADLWQAASPPKELWIVPGGTHGNNQRVAPEEYERRVVEFFNHSLLYADGND